MGNYIDAELFEERVTTTRLSGLTKLTGDAKTALIESIVERAESLVDGYLAARYTVPVPANKLTEEWALAIAEYELYKRGPGADVPEKIKQSYEYTLAQLKDASAGKLGIPSAVSPSPSSVAGSSMTVHGARPLMDEHSMEGF